MTVKTRIIRTRRLDDETGLYYYRMRYYNPDIGRFLQPDPPYAYTSMGLYHYCWNNPINWIDPYGENVFGGFVSWIGGSGWDNSVDMGVAEAKEFAKAAGVGAIDGATIYAGQWVELADTVTFGQIDALGEFSAYASQKVSGYGAAGRWSRGFALISRDVAITVGGIKGTAAIQRALAGRKTVIVARWGRQGLKSGDWVMRGGNNPWNYLMSGKYQPIANQFASYSSGASYTVPGSALQAPGGFFGSAKTAVGQFIFSP
ncbi:MAG TPA: RHS repeat-associated core domain-containing protein [Methanosarcinales archaeon]|nr:RHS repeat-associated core domain-containing protein [Methanosarcinales archaeon]